MVRFRRPRWLPKLRFVSWCVAVGMLLVVALLQVSGVVEGDHQLLHPSPRNAPSSIGGGGFFSVPEEQADAALSDEDLPIVVREYTHGWPVPWLRRALGYGDPPWRGDMDPFAPFHSHRLVLREHPIAWSAPQAWPFSADAWRIAPLGLLLNLAIAALLIGLPTAGCEWWLRSRGGLWRFRLIDLLALTTLTAAGLGFWRWDRAEVKRENASFPTSNFSLVYGANSLPLGQPSGREWLDYCGPVWVERLVGNSRLVPFMRRHTATYFTLGYDNPSPLPMIRQLHYLEFIEMNSLPDEELSRAIGDLARLKDLTIEQLYGVIVFTSPEDPNPDFRELSRLRSIERISIQHNCILLEDILPLLESPSLRELSINSNCIAPSAIEELNRQHPSIEISYWNPNNDSEANAVLHAHFERWRRDYDFDRPTRIESDYLNMSGVLMTDETLAILRPMLPSLNYLEIKEADLTAEGIRILAEESTVNRLAITGDWLNDELLLAIGKMRSLQFLGVRQGEATLDGFVQLLEKKKLATLRIDNCTLTDEQLQQLDQMDEQMGMMIEGEWR